MDKAVRGLVEGRYEWIAFTSVNAVKAVGSASRSTAWTPAPSPASRSPRSAEDRRAIAAWGLKADLVPSGEQSAAGLLADWPGTTSCSTPSTGCSCPGPTSPPRTSSRVWSTWAGSATTSRLPHGAGGAAPAPTREAIKTGKFDAVVFTSSSTVRNLVGIAGKPHPSTIIAVIGPATAKTVEEHGLRVDVMAPKPDVELLVDALADFGEARRLAMVEAGKPATRPSQRRPSARRKASSR
ncbi:MAG: uroporphyrinogen-III synthase [Nocardioides sp.]